MEKIKFLHIGRTGGTTLTQIIQNNSILKKKIEILGHFQKIDEYDKIIFAIRNPITRFISAFYHRKNKVERLVNDGRSSYVPIKERAAFKHYQNIGSLLSDLFSDNFCNVNKAKFALRNIMHLGKIGTYRFWFKNIKKPVKKNVFFIIKFENYKSDLLKLLKNLRVKIKRIPHFRPSKLNKDVIVLNNELEKKLILFLEDDYIFISMLKRNKILPNSYLKKEFKFLKKKRNINLKHKDIFKNKITNYFFDIYFMLF